MAGFDLASVLAESVSNLDTAQETIQLIPMELIQADPDNFYSMEGIKELAANIELFGLMDPIRLRKKGEGYIVVSGHRRFAAMTMLAESGNENFKQIPAIEDKPGLSPAMQELRLIFANSDTRKMSSADMLKQTERVTELLYKLQEEEGVVFPGRMRDHVAQACKVSASKIARLNAIKNGLGAEGRELFDNGTINESVAYELAGMPKSHQNLILTVLKQQDIKITQNQVENYARYLKKIIAIPCTKQEGCCSHFEGKLTNRATTKYYWNLCCEHRCCKDCDKLAKCKYVCPQVVKEQEKAKAKAKAQNAEVRAANKAEREAKEAAEKTALERLTALYKNANKLMKAANAESDKISKIVACYNAWYIKDCLAGKLSSLRPSESVFGSSLSLETLDRLCGMADALGVSLDQLLLHTPVSIAPPEPHPAAAAMTWQTGLPPKKGMYAVEIGEAPYTCMDIAYWCAGKFWFDKSCDLSVDETVVRWFRLPDWEDE